jgi:hypothetical protein
MATNQSRDNLRPVLVVAGLVLLGSGIASLALGADTTELLLGIGGGILTAGIVFGTYYLGRRSGHPESHAVAEAAIAFGGLFLIGVSFQLLYSFGAADEPSALGVAGVLAAALALGAVIVGLIVGLERFGPSPA